MRELQTLSGYVIRRVSFFKRDALDIFAHDYGKVRCWLSISIPFYHRIDEADFCELEISESRLGSLIVTGLLNVKTPICIRSNLDLFECWNAVSELVNVCVERDSQDPVLFKSFENCVHSLSLEAVRDFVIDLAVLAGIAQPGISVWSAIVSLEDYAGRRLNLRRLFEREVLN